MLYPLEIDSLTKKFGDTAALKSVTLSVEKGKIYGLLGPNGAGKTTLLRIINNLLVADSGSVRINGEPVSFATSRHLGYMPEERGLYEKMTVEEHIMFFGKLKGASVRRLKEVMSEYMDTMDLKKDSTRKIKELSKGNQQKVQIVATLAHEPSVIMLDEPFSGFDPINGRLLTTLIEHLREKGTTVILSSHNMPAVEELCSDIALINHGELILDGTLSEIKERDKENKYIVDLSSPLPEDAESNGIKAQLTDSENGKFRYLITKTEPISNSALISGVTGKGADILHFEEKLPTLNELFIKYAK